MIHELANWIKQIKADVYAILIFADWLEEKGQYLGQLREFNAEILNATRIWGKWCRSHKYLAIMTKEKVLYLNLNTLYLIERDRREYDDEEAIKVTKEVMGTTILV